MALLWQQMSAYGEGCEECDSCCCTEEPADEWNPDCVEYRCYTPPYYDLCGDSGRSFQADFLYWFAKENQLAYTLEAAANESVTSSGVNYSPQKYEYLGTKWLPGLRIGTGWYSACDGWDGLVVWSYAQNHTKDSTSVAPFISADLPVGSTRTVEVLLNPWINPAFTFDSNPLLFDKVTAKWKLNWNQVDLELARKYWLSNSFTMRPYAGVRVAWITTQYSTQSFRNFTTTPSIATQLITFKDSFKAKTWGAGLLGGVQPNWYMCDNFVLAINCEFALLWQRFHGKKKEKYSAPHLVAPIAYSNHFQNVFYTMQMVWDLGAALRWEQTWCCDRFRTALEVGYEHHMWLHFNQLPTFSDRIAGSGSFNLFNHVDYVTTDLMLGGGVARLRLDF